jgi:hypothetical protein
MCDANEEKGKPKTIPRRLLNFSINYQKLTKFSLFWAICHIKQQGF